MEINDKTEKQLSSTKSVDHRLSIDGANIVWFDKLTNKVYHYNFEQGRKGNRGWDTSRYE